jgi:hypothetical protein
MGQMQVPGSFSIALHPFHKAFSHQHEGDAGKALDAFARATGHHVNVWARDVQCFPAEPADRIDQKRPILAIDHLGRFLHRIDQSGGRFMMHHRHYLHLGMLPQRQAQLFDVRSCGPVQL